MKIIEINKCFDCNGKGTIGHYKSKRGKITRIFNGSSNVEGIQYILKLNKKDYLLGRKGKSFSLCCKDCPKCKGTGESEKITIKNKAKTIKIYNTYVKGWEIVK